MLITFNSMYPLLAKDGNKGSYVALVVLYTILIIPLLKKKLQIAALAVSVFMMFDELNYNVGTICNNDKNRN